MADISFEAGVPVLPSVDVPKAAEFYRDVLGFEILALTEEPYAVIRRGEVSLHLWQTEDPGLPSHCGCRIRVSGIQNLFEKLRPLGIVHPNLPLTKQPWNAWEFAIGDPDGNLITFVELVADG